MLTAQWHHHTILIHGLRFAPLEVGCIVVHVDINLPGHTVDIKPGALLGNLIGDPIRVNAERIQAFDVGIRVALVSDRPRALVGRDGTVVLIQLPRHVDQMNPIEFREPVT